MIKKAEIKNILEMADFAYQLNSKEETSCKSCAKEKHLIKNQFDKIMNDTNNFILTSYANDELRGVFACLVEPDEKYLECLGGFFMNEEALDEIILYLKNNYSGYHLDLIYPKENRLVLNYLKKINGNFDPMQFEMEIVKEQVQRRNDDINIIKSLDNYFEGYKKIHTTDCYWTADKVLQAPDRFHVYLAIDRDKVIGYLDISKSHPEIANVYHIYVLEDYRKKGYGRALLERAIEDAFLEKKKVTLAVNYDNDAAYGLYSSIGFVETGNSITIGVDL